MKTNASDSFDQLEVVLGEKFKKANPGHGPGDIGSMMGAAEQALCPEKYQAIMDVYSAQLGAESSSATPETPEPPPAPLPALTVFSDGKHLVGTDPNQIVPGTHTINGTVTDCYWERSDSQGNIIDNNVSIAPSLTVTIDPSDEGFTSQGCGTWTKTG